MRYEFIKNKSLLSSQARIQVPWVKVTIGDYTFGVFDEKTKSAIGTTKLYYTPGNGNTTITTLERSIFLLSWYELGETMFCNNEGTPLSIASTLLNVSSPFWTRSPRISNTSDVAYKGKSVAGTTKATATTTSYGDLTCKPCFTLPSTAVFDETTMLLKGVA